MTPNDPDAAPDGGRLAVTSDPGVVTTPAVDLGGTRLVPGDWVERARCGGHDPELFYPVGTAGPALAQVAEAKAVCSRCPVVGDCLDWALDVGEGHGIWGGTTPEERRYLRQDRGDPARRGVPELRAVT